MLTDQNIIFIAIGAVAVAFTIWMIWLETRLKRIFRGNGAKNLETLLANLAKDIDEMKTKIRVNETSVVGLQKELEQSNRHVGIVRFNAFQEAGGNQSFAIAALDDKRNGFVLSTIHNRESNRVYAKPIINAGSEFHLSEEEKEAITRALAREIPSSK